MYCLHRSNENSVSFVSGLVTGVKNCRSNPLSCPCVWSGAVSGPCFSLCVCLPALRRIVDKTRLIKNEGLEEGPSQFHQMIKVLLNFTLNVCDLKDQDLGSSRQRSVSFRDGYLISVFNSLQILALTNQHFPV